MNPYRFRLESVRRVRQVEERRSAAALADAQHKLDAAEVAAAAATASYRALLGVVSAASVPVAPVLEAPVEVTPVGITPVGITPVGFAPVEGVPMQASPAEVAPVGFAPVGLATAEIAPVDAVLVQSAPAHVGPVDGAPVGPALFGRPVEDWKAERWRAELGARRVHESIAAAAAARLALEQARHEWAAASGRLQALDRLDLRRRAEHRRAVGRAEQIMVDDLVTARWARSR